MSVGSQTGPTDDKYTYGMVAVVLPLPGDIKHLSAHYELLYGLRRLQQLALELFRLVSP